jgi:hypothetical protein
MIFKNIFAKKLIPGDIRTNDLFPSYMRCHSPSPPPQEQKIIGSNTCHNIMAYNGI